MKSSFDRIIDRRTTESAKWQTYPGDVLPLWVADMDFRAPIPVIDALQERVAHGIFGYAQEPPELRQLIVERLQRLYGWQVSPEALIFLPGVVVGFNLAIRALTLPGDGVLVQTPVYHPILDAPLNWGCRLDEMQLTRLTGGSYGIDFEAFEGAISGRTRLFILCNPHNPVGRVFREEELVHMAEVCLRYDLAICSDEIHCDLLFRGHRHLPIASLAPEIGERTITLIAPTKTFSLPGLHVSVAIVQNPELRRRMERAQAGIVSKYLNVLAYTAALAAYRDGQAWLDELMAYLESNRNYVKAFADTDLPGISVFPPEATYLAWLDCRSAGLEGNPHRFFLERARVALNDGATFGRGGEGFVRLNFACPRSVLVEALDRMKAALVAQ